MTVLPLGIECYAHAAAIGVPCTPDGTCCPNRIGRAELIGKGAELLGAIADAAERARRATAPELEPVAPSPVLGEDDDAPIARPPWLPTTTKGQA